MLFLTLIHAPHFSQRPRWYPTAVTLSNGSILVVGGTDTESGNAQPNLEILPRIPGGDTTIYLDFLAQTHPWNLYPFLFVLPSGNIFIGESILLFPSPIPVANGWIIHSLLQPSPGLG